MLKRILFLNMFFISFFLNSCTTQKSKTSGIEIRDALNRKVVLTHTPKRVITLAPNLTEMLFSLGLGNKIVGNTTYCNYPPEAKLKEKVGNLISLNFEKILSLQPDLIFMTVEGDSRNNFNRLKELGLNIFVSNPRNYDGIKKTLLSIAKIFRKEDKARQIVARWDSTINKISLTSHKQKKLKAMFLVSVKPLMLAGKNTFINSFLNICNMENIAQSSPSNYPIFSREKILQENPDVILLAFSTPQKIKARLLKTYAEWKGLKAIRNNKIFVFPPDLFLRPGPRFVNAVKYLFDKTRNAQSGSQ